MTDAEASADDFPIQATFLLVLPDPLPIPHGSTWTQTLDEPEPLLDQIETRFFEDGPLTTNRGTNYVSLKFWQLKDEKALPSEFEYGMVLSTRVLSMLTGSGAAMPIERKPSDEAEQPSRTVVEAVTFVAKEADLVRSEAKPDPLSRCIDVLLAYHRAYRLATRKHVRALTYERLHPAVLWTRRSLSERSRHEPMGLIMLENRNFNFPNIEDLDPAQYESLTQYYTRDAAGDPFAILAERRLEAEIELWTTGELGKAAVEVAIAAEVLFGSILGMMMWEEHLAGQITKTDAAAVFSQDVMPRLKSQYNTRLGGNWSFKSEPMKGWLEKLSDLRNRVVHAGYRPDKNEAADALEALHALEHFIGDRLAANWKRYPRTAWAFLGTEGLRKRGRLRRAQEWWDEDGGRIRDWISDYARWREAVNAEVIRRRANS